MKKTLFLFFTLVVTTSCIQANLDSFIDQLARDASLEKEDVQRCVNKANITFEDFQHYAEIRSLPTEPFNDRILKIGCFFACFDQKRGLMTGAHLKIDKIKDFVRSKYTRRTPDELATRMQIVDRCSDLVKNKTNECEVSFQFVLCYETGAGLNLQEKHKDHV